MSMAAPRLFPRELLEQWHQTRKALSDDDVAGWKPLLDKYEISAVMIEPSDAPVTYGKLMQSPNWVPFYDDGRIVMFGRADAPATDLAFFKANKLDADLLAYRTTHPVAGAERPPNPTSWIDGVFQNRTLSRPQSRTESARRWLDGPLQEREKARARQPQPASGPGSLHPGDSGGTHGTRPQPRRLDCVPKTEGCLSLLDDPGKRDARRRSDHARKRGSHHEA